MSNVSSKPSVGPGSASGKELKKAQKAPLSVGQGMADVPDPMSPEMLRPTLIRVGLILGGLWLVGGLIAAMATSSVVRWVALGVPAALSALIVGVLVWTLKRAKTAREMASLLKGVETEEDRQQALQKLELESKDGDPAKLFAKAQLEMQADPKTALATLEKIDLVKHKGTVADEARSQRAMIHLMMGQVSLARQLVDNVDLKRHPDHRSRAMLTVISAEAWARSGDAARALSVLAEIDLKDEQLAPLRPQLLRAQAYAYAHAAKTKELRHALKQMLAIDVRLLAGFLQNKSHPLLMKEAKKMVEQSGMVPRKMQFSRK